MERVAIRLRSSWVDRHQFEELVLQKRIDQRSPRLLEAQHDDPFGISLPQLPHPVMNRLRIGRDKSTMLLSSSTSNRVGVLALTPVHSHHTDHLFHRTLPPLFGSARWLRFCAGLIVSPGMDAI